MNYRKASSDEHKTICKQVRSDSILKVCLMAPIVPLFLLAFGLSLKMMTRDNYDKITFIVSAVILGSILISLVVFIFGLMKGFIRRIHYINQNKYQVADCIVAGKNQRRNPKHVHCFVTVAFPNGNTLTVNVPAKVYSLAENGKKGSGLRVR